MALPMTRRELLRAAAASCVLSILPRPASARQLRTRLVLLGTGGGPTPKKLVSAPAQVIIVDGTPYVVDCGDGVARQLVLADVPLVKLRHIFITHQHSDHNADYGNLILLAWASGLATRVDTWGPPPLARMTDLFFEMDDYDIRTRISDEGRPPLRPLVHAHEITKSGVVMRDENVTVTSALVEHPLVAPAFAYRFDGPDRSIVISGDTARSEHVVELARGADVLVHEALWVPAIDRILARDPNASTLKKHLLASHTAAEDCGRVAEAAGVKTLVLSHLVPGGDASITDQMWLDAAGKYFKGRIIVGKDLMEI
ncbi:MAG: MBL fold metallo-hydrolase [Betaproteobacteria bacterium]